MYGLRYRGALESTTQAELEGLIAALQEFLLREHNEDGTHRPQESGIEGVPIGFIGVTAASTPPPNWLLCDGRPVSRTTYRHLFKAIGTTYGAGNGVDTFNLPDLRRRFALGVGSGVSLAETGGEWDHVHTVVEDGEHNHGGATSEDGLHGHGNLVIDGFTGAPSAAIGVQSGSGATVAAAGHDHDVTAGINSDGAHTHDISEASGHDHGGETGDNNPPYLALHYIILAGPVAGRER